MRFLTSALYSPATDVPAAGSAASTGADSAASQAGANQPLSAAAIIDAWVEGDAPEDTGTEAKPRGDASEEGQLSTDEGDGKAGDGDDKTGAPALENQGTGGQLDGLLEELLTLPDAERKDSAAYKRGLKLLGEPAALKQKLAEANDKLADVEGPPIVVQPATATDPFADVGSEAQLNERIEQLEAADVNAQRWLDWIEDHPEGGKAPNGKELDAEQVKAVKASARETQRAVQHQLTKGVPAKQEYLKKLGETRKALRESTPDLFKKDSPLLKECVQLVHEGRIGTRHPDYMQDALDLAEGRRLRAERASGKQHITLDAKKAAEAAASKINGQGTTTARPGPSGQAGSGKAPASRSAGAGPDLKGAKTAAAKGHTPSLAVVVDAFAAQ